MIGDSQTQKRAWISDPRELLAGLQLFRATQQVIFRFKVEKGPKAAEIESTLPSGEKKEPAGVRAYVRAS